MLIAQEGTRRTGIVAVNFKRDETGISVRQFMHSIVAYVELDQSI